MAENFWAPMEKSLIYTHEAQRTARRIMKIITKTLGGKILVSKTKSETAREKWLRWQEPADEQVHSFNQKTESRRGEDIFKELKENSHNGNNIQSHRLDKNESWQNIPK